MHRAVATEPPLAVAFESGFGLSITIGDYSGDSHEH